MDQDEQLLHASSFGAAADAYAEHRPDYTQTAVRWVLEPAPGPRVLDLGAGTGKLTATLVALGAEVIAVEPDPALLTELRRSLPAVRALPGSAEAIPLLDASVDAVPAGNALHWFDMAVAGPEIARVLAPGGILAGLWKVMDDQVDWVAGLARVSGSAAIGPRDTPAGITSTPEPDARPRARGDLLRRACRRDGRRSGRAATGPDMPSARSVATSARQSPPRATASARPSRFLPGSCTARGLRPGFGAARRQRVIQAGPADGLHRPHAAGLLDHGSAVTWHPHASAGTDARAHVRSAFGRCGNEGLDHPHPRWSEALHGSG